MKERSRGFLIAGIISMVILGFGLLSISESFAGELSEGEMDILGGGACMLRCISHASWCETHDFCDGQTKEECPDHYYIQGAENRNYGCEGTECIRCSRSDEKLCRREHHCIWRFNRCTMNPINYTTVNGYNNCTDY